MSQKLLVIVGPTATGKTNLAFKLSGKFNGVPISADSRQVYKFMDIGTGKEEKMQGYDLALPNEEFNVSNYLEFADKTIKNIYREQKLPILVGGTGFYVNAVLYGIDTVNIPPDEKLRKTLESKDANELFGILKKADPKKAKSMNESDRKNPRRLIRAIEISNSHYNPPKKNKPNFDALIIGLTAPKEILKKGITKRVAERIKMGFEKEIKLLKQEGYWDKIPSHTIGYKDFPDIKKWEQEEVKYAKRQLTWFKKVKNTNWFDITIPNWQKKVEDMVKLWLDAKKSRNLS